MSKAATSRRTPNMNVADTNSVLLPNRSPLVTFRILFMTVQLTIQRQRRSGSLTGRCSPKAGSRVAYSEITDAMYPMPLRSLAVDKEMSVFSGSTTRRQPEQVIR